MIHELDPILVNELGKAKRFNVDGASARLFIFSDDVARLTSVMARKKGIGAGRAIMEKICRYADEHGLDLVLYVQRYGDPRQGLSNAQLIEFYRKFGFHVDGDFKQPVMMWRSSQE